MYVNKESNKQFNPDIHPYKGGWWPQGHSVKCQEVLEAIEHSAVNRTWIKV